MNSIRLYVVTTGTIFALITVAHLVRLAYEPHLLRDAVFLSLTVLTVLLTAWAIRLRRVS